MTNHKPFDMRSRGFTELEALHMVPLKVQEPAPLWVLVVIGLSLAVLFIHLFFVPLIPLPEAHAEALEEVIRQNDYYCRQLTDGVPRVVGAHPADVAALCAEYL